MKISRIISRLFLFLLFVGFSMSNSALAQEENEIKIRIQIETEENGEKKSIDKTVESKEDLMKLLEELWIIGLSVFLQRQTFQNRCKIFKSVSSFLFQSFIF